jgi:uncharacterized spore protein YtfJ
MIDYLVGGEFMDVTSNKGAIPYIKTSNTINGMVAFDGSNQTMKVYDGNGWQTIGGGGGNINLSPNAITILKWAEKKMLEEAERNKLAETNPAIKDLISHIKQKEEQINMIKTLLNSPGHNEIKNSMAP